LFPAKLGLTREPGRFAQNKGYISYADVAAVRPDLEPAEFFSHFATQTAASVLMSRSQSAVGATGAEPPKRPDSDIIRFSDFNDGLRVRALASAARAKLGRKYEFTNARSWPGVPIPRIRF
jgi:hypothetical protein